MVIEAFNRVPFAKNTSMLNILISSAGRQTTLIRQFRNALGYSGCLLVADADPLAAAAPAANRAFVSPRFDREEYIPWLFDVCSRHKVGTLLSLNPDELFLLEHYREDLLQQGIFLIGMPLSKLRMCCNKRLLTQLCEPLGIITPPMWSVADLHSIPQDTFPLIAKPIYGRGSRGLIKLKDLEKAQVFEAELDNERAGDYLLQPLLEGEEYGLDLINDLSGDHVATFIRRKLRMRDGETEVAETIFDPQLKRLGGCLSAALRHQGIVDCDVMRANGIDYLLDVNARFGGGYAFSHEAGGNVPGAIVAWLKNESPRRSWLAPTPGVRSARASFIQSLSGSPPTLVFVTTADYAIGMGHAAREITLAARAQAIGYRAVVLTDSSKVVTQAYNVGLESLQLDIFDEYALSTTLASHKPNSVIIDVHERDFPCLRWISDQWPVVLIVSRVGYDFDFFGREVVLVGEDLEYWRTERKAGKDVICPRVHAGRAFVWFRQEFDQNTMPDAGTRGPNLLIAHGGSDPYGLTYRSLAALEYCRNRYNIEILIGPAFQGVESIQHMAAQSSHNCIVTINTDNVAERMTRSSVALINGGNIRYELCLTGTPFVALSIQQRQYVCTEAIAQLGIGINLGVVDNVKDHDIASAVDDLMNDTVSLSQMSRHMRSLFDTLGVDRVIDLVPKKQTEIDR
jgi:carbamoyl-phosphate synthase large subunit